MELTGLPQFDPEEAQWRADVLFALNGQRAGDAALRAAFPAGLPPRLGWFLCNGGGAFAFDLLKGERADPGPDDADCAIGMLEKAEPVLHAIERALGIELDPEALGEFEGEGTLLRIDGIAEERLLHRLYLSLPKQMSLTPDRAPFAPELLGEVPLGATMRIKGPRVAPHDAADLASGDLLLLGPGPLRAALTIADRPGIEGHFDPALNDFKPIDEPRNRR